LKQGRRQVFKAWGSGRVVVDFPPVPFIPFMRPKIGLSDFRECMRRSVGGWGSGLLDSPFPAAAFALKSMQKNLMKSMPKKTSIK